MKLTQIELTDFRNIAHAKLFFEGQRNFFVGDNGQGKTNLLEAISLASRLSSFRTHKREPMIAHDRPRAVVHSIWQHEQRGQTTLALAIAPSKITTLLDTVATKTATATMGIFPIISLSLADRELVYAGPAARRDEIDHLICQLDPSYTETLADYEKATKSRNALLAQTPAATPAQFEAFEIIMEAAARRMIRSRARANELLAPLLAETFATFGRSDETPAIVYTPNCAEGELRSQWESLRATKDAILGYTTRGPHRDHFDLTLSGHAAELYASEGQKFSIVLALKLAGLKLLRQKLGIAPVLVCDDLLLELDAGRQERFWSGLGDCQVFASGTSLPKQPQGAPQWKIWRATQGVFTLEG